MNSTKKEGDIQMPTNAAEARQLGRIALQVASQQPGNSHQRHVLVAFYEAAQEVAEKFVRLEQAVENVQSRLARLREGMARDGLKASINSQGELGTCSDANDLDRLCVEFNAAMRHLARAIRVTNALYPADIAEARATGASVKE